MTLEELKSVARGMGYHVLPFNTKERGNKGSPPLMTDSKLLEKAKELKELGFGRYEIHKALPGSHHRKQRLLPIIFGTIPKRLGEHRKVSADKAFNKGLNDYVASRLAGISHSRAATVGFGVTASAIPYYYKPRLVSLGVIEPTKPFRLLPPWNGDPTVL